MLHLVLAHENAGCNGHSTHSMADVKMLLVHNYSGGRGGGWGRGVHVKHIL